MKHIKVPVWRHPEIKEHVATRYRFCRDVSMTDEYLIEEKTIDGDTSEGHSIHNYYFHHIVPIGSTYFATATRIFDNGDEEEMGPISLYSEDEYILSDSFIDYGVEIPYVTVESFYDGDTFTIKTGPIRAGGLGHKASNFVIENDKGKTVFQSLYNEENLRELTVDKTTLDLTDTNTIIVKVSHINSNGVHSDYGSYIIRDIRNHAYFTTDVHYLDPSIDNNLGFYIENTNIEPEVIRFYRNGEKLFDIEITDIVKIDDNNYTFLLPADNLIYEKHYNVRIYFSGRMSDNDFVELKARTMIRNRNYFIVNDYQYQGLTIEAYVPNVEEDEFPPHECYIEGLPNRLVIGFNKNGRVTMFKHEDKRLQRMGIMSVVLPSTPDLSKPYNIHYVNDAYVTIFYYTTNGKLALATLLLELHYGNAEMVKFSILEDIPLTDVGKVFSTVSRGSDKLYYYTHLQTGAFRFYSVDYKSHEKTQHNIPVNGNLIGNGMTSLLNGSIIMFSKERDGEDVPSIYHVFDVKNNMWRVGDVLPDSVDGLDYKPVMLKNGKVAIFQDKNNDETNNEPYEFYLYNEDIDTYEGPVSLGTDFLGTRSIIRFVDGSIFFANEGYNVIQYYK